MPTAAELAAHLDTLLGTRGFPDYPTALNGLQLQHRGPVTAVATAVDFSRGTIEAAIARGANFLILHHGMYWSGLRSITGPAYDRLQLLFRHDIAVYAAHLPLDAHPGVGNNALLAAALQLTPDGRFGSYQGTDIGVAGTDVVPTAELLARLRQFAVRFGGTARASHFDADRVTRRWAVLTGAGAGSTEISEAAARGIDTLIVGEGPHHTTVDAPDAGLVILYGGHYATETLGVQALAAELGRVFGLRSEFLALPTGS
jgi:dinuclear metal center YbgI/SA1388 family protein